MKMRTLELIDFEKVNVLLEGFNNATGFVTAIIDLDGNVLSKSGWREICTEFHRVHPETSKKCTISDTELSVNIASGKKYHAYKCLNGLIDVAVPIIINDEHIANLFSGQFFFEKPNLNFFKKQAEKYKFDNKTYFKALDKVPVVSEEKVKKAMDFLLNMTQIISEMTQQKIEQIELNKTLKESEERWQFALEGNGDGVWDWDAQTNKVFFSKRWKEMLGYEDDEIGTDINEWEKRIHPDDIEKCHSDLNKHFNGKTDFYENEHRVLCKDGSYKWILDRGKVMSWQEDKKPLRVIGTHIDLSSRKQAEAELFHEKELSEKIIETSTAIIVGLDKNHLIQIFNKGAENITGYSKAEVIGRDWFNLFFPVENFEKMSTVWKKAWGQKTHSYKNTIKIKSGEERIISFQNNGIYDGKDSSKHILISIGEDITDRKLVDDKIKQLNEELENKVILRTTELEKKGKDLIDSQNALLNIVEDLNEKSEQIEKDAVALASVNKELESFSYSVSHDLRAPLRGIDGFSLALLEDYGDVLDEQGKGYLNRVRNGTQKMALLIDEMLNLSRLGRMALKPTTVNLSEIAQSINDDFRISNPKRSVEIIIAKEITSFADPTLIRAVLQNLLENAWKFTSKKAKTTIEFGALDIEGKRTYFVKDNGAGFNMEYKNKLFTPFQRLHQESEFTGTGIGLTTVQRIINRHSGKLWAESEIDKGATFYFTLNL